MGRLRHGGTGYRVLGETARDSQELASAIRTHFPMLPDRLVREEIRILRRLNDVHGAALERHEEEAR